MPRTQEGIPSGIKGSVGRLAATLFTLLALPSMASALTVIDFEEFTHGEVVTSSGGITIEADNFNRAFDLAVAFDSGLAGTADPDLEAGMAVWSGGNLQGTQLGKMLILQENEAGCGTGVCSSPDDERIRPAGTLSFLFDGPVLSFGFDLVDVDSLGAENGAVTFFDTMGGSLTIDFVTLLAGFEIGDNTANRISPIDLSQLDIGDVEQVEILLGGSGAIDNVAFETAVPEPGTALLLGLGLSGLGYAGRRRTR